MTTIAEASPAYETMKLLEKELDYKVVKEPLYHRRLDGYGNLSHHQVDRYALVRRDYPAAEAKVIGTCSKKFQPVQMRDTILRNTEAMLQEGWFVAPIGTGRRSPIRIEKNGLRAYVELIHEEGFTLNHHDTSKIHPRFVMFNGFDLQTRFGGTAGGYRYSCANGMHTNFDFMGVVGSRHIGKVATKIDDLKRMAEIMMKNYYQLMGVWDGMTIKKILPSRGLAAVESVSLQKGKEIVAGLEKSMTSDLTAWDWYNAITKWLTFSFKGSQQLFNQKQEKAEAILMGRVTYEETRFLKPEDRYRMVFE